MNGEPIPLARAGSARWSRTVSWVVATVIAGVAVILARAYQRPAPIPEPPAPGINEAASRIQVQGARYPAHLQARVGK